MKQQIVSRRLLVNVLVMALVLWGTGVHALDVQQLEYAAELGDVASQMRLAEAYRTGRGIEQDERRAAYWYGRAAAQGDPAGEAFLGWMYENGVGLDRNRNTARFWYKKAASQGYGWARTRLAELDAQDQAGQERAGESTADTGRGTSTGTTASRFGTDAGTRMPGSVQKSGPDQGYQAATRTRPAQGSYPGAATTARERSSRGEATDWSAPAAQPPVAVDGGAGEAFEVQSAAALSAPSGAADEVDDYRTARRQLEDLVRNSMLFKVPERVAVGKEDWVTLSLTRGLRYEEFQVPGVGVRITAKLSAVGVYVEPVSVEEQALRPGIPPHWAWQVSAAESGEHKLHLKLTARITVPGREARILELPGKERSLTVGAEFSQGIKAFIAENALPIGATLLLPLLVWLWLSLKPKKKG